MVSKFGAIALASVAALFLTAAPVAQAQTAFGGNRGGSAPHRSGGGGGHHSGGYHGGYHGGYRHHGGGGWGGAAAGLAAGALIGGLLASQPNYYYGPPPDDYEYEYDGGPSVEWCIQHYRSYDVRTQTYLGYDGYRHPCP